MKRKVLQGVAVCMLLLMAVAAIPRVANAVGCEFLNEFSAQFYIDSVTDDVLDVVQAQAPNNARAAAVVTWIAANQSDPDLQSVIDDLAEAVTAKAVYITAIADCNADLSVADIAYSNEDYCPGVDDALQDVIHHVGEGATAVDDVDFWLLLCEIFTT